MRILAMYIDYDLSVLRRVKAPLSVLHQRGHNFTFMKVPSFIDGLAYGHDVTVLPNLVLSDEEFERYQEVVRERCIIYDLSDMSLLSLSRVRQQVKLAHLVTVPNDFYKKEVEVINKNVAVTPSVIDVETFRLANREPKPDFPIIGCFGPWDWKLVKDALSLVKEKHPKLRISGDKYAWEILGSLIMAFDVLPHDYPRLLRDCLFGLCPTEGEKGIDEIWSLEYGIFCRPILQLHGPQNTDRWVQHIETMLTDDIYRNICGNKYYDKANDHRATALANEYLAAYRKKLPLQYSK